MGSRAAVRYQKNNRDPGCLLLLHLLTPAVEVTATCNKGSNAQTTVDFKFSLVSNLFLVPSSFAALDLPPLLCFTLFSVGVAVEEIKGNDAGLYPVWG